MKVFITGGTGLVGSRLTALLHSRGHEVLVLTRRPQAAQQSETREVVTGDPTVAGPWIDRAAAADAIVNLAGENLFARRWTDTFKQLIRDSRVQATTNCVEAIRRNPRGGDGGAKVLVNASAVGYYGPHGDEELDEDAPPGNDFLAQTCVDWERAASAARDLGARLVIGRFGMVLDAKRGALVKMMTPFHLFVGGPVGSGRQYISWVHVEDCAAMLLFALETASASGPVNVTAPVPVTNKEFSRALGKAMGRPSFMWAPGFALRVALGEVAEVITTGQRVLPRRAQQWGYAFQFADLAMALTDLLEKRSRVAV